MSFYDDASLIMYPSGYKEDKIYSLKPTDGSGDLTFTRASNGTRVNSAGLVEVCPWNLVQYSEEFNNAYWTKALATITSNATTAPNGTTTADRVRISNSARGVVLLIDSTTAGTTLTFSLYAKANGQNLLRLFCDQTCVYFQGGSIVTLTNEWVRYSLTVTATQTGNIVFGFDNVSDSTTTCNGTNGTTDCFVWGAQLNIGSTAKPYFPTTDRLNVPRIDYTGGGCGSLLLEKQSTNSQTYSQDLTNGSAWGLGSTTISANSIISPDGTQNADKLVEDSSTNRHELYGKSLTYSGTTSVSFFAKLGERRYFSAFVAGNPALGGATFDLQTGTITATSGGTNANIEEYLNGWYRCSFTTTSTATTTLYICLRTNGGAPNIETYAGDGVSGIYFWGGQTEISSTYPTSYIPTLASSVTRLADAALKTGISSLIGATEGTLFLDITTTDDITTVTPIGISDGTGSNRVLLYVGSGILNALVTVSGVAQATISSSAISANTRYKMAIAYKANDFVFYVNGVQIGTDTSGSVPACSKFNYDNGSGSAPFYGLNNQAILFPTRLTNTQLATLTTL